MKTLKHLMSMMLACALLVGSQQDYALAYGPGTMPVAVDGIGQLE